MKMCRIRGLLTPPSPFAHFPGHFLCVKMIIVLVFVLVVWDSARSPRLLLDKNNDDAINHPNQNSTESTSSLDLSEDLASWPFYPFFIQMFFKEVLFQNNSKKSHFVCKVLSKKSSNWRKFCTLPILCQKLSVQASDRWKLKNEKLSVLILIVIFLISANQIATFKFSAFFPLNFLFWIWKFYAKPLKHCLVHW